MNQNDILNNIMNNSSMMSNPVAVNALKMFRSNDSDGLKLLAENVCQSKGTTVDAIRQEISKKLGM